MVFAQEAVTTGVVIDEATGEPMIGVNVYNTATMQGSITDLEGTYRIAAGTGDILQYSFVGYFTEVREASELINVSMREDLQSLEEVVVIGYGRVKKSDLTGSVSSVRGADLTKVTSSSPVQALQGKVAGVQVSSNSGEPGSSPTVRVRGIGTWGNPDPIYVVDGVILDDISFLSSSDIASMEVLKDASSTAMYGSRGANGVIIVTTKLGDASGKMNVNLVANFEVQTIQKYIDMLDAREFATTMNKIMPGSFNNLDLLEDHDWQKLVYRKAAPMQNYQLSVAGGGERHSYYASGGYYSQEGIIPGSAYDRLSIKLNNTFSVSKNLKVGQNLTLSNYHKDNTPNVVASTLRAWPTDPAYKDDGSFYGNRGNGNPLASIEYTNSTNQGLRGVGNFFGELTFLKNFTFRSSFGFDLEESQGQSFTPVYFVTSQQSNDETALSKSRSGKTDWLWENTLNYHLDQGAHFLDVLAGYTSQESNFESLSASGKNLLRDDILYLSNDLEDVLIYNSASKWSMVSYLFRANYVLNSKYMLTSTFRMDGSSAFSEENRWGYFPSFAAGWRISEEDFFSSNSISDLKLRASWGIVGNDKVDTDERFTLIQQEMGAVFGAEEVLYPGATYGKSGNPLVRWEEASQADLGAELGLWENKLSLEMDYYYKVTRDILMDLPLAGHMGNGSYTYVKFNAADVLNTGVELLVNWKDQAGDVFYEISANASTIHNEVLKLGEDVEADNFIPLGNLGNGQNVKRVAVGEPIGYFYGYNVIGVFQDEEELNSYPHMALTEVGDFKYEDVTGDGSLTPEDRTYLGSPVPDFIFGLSGSASWKGLSLSLDFQGEVGKQIYDGKDAVRAGQYNYQQRVADAWDGAGSTNTEPRVSSSTLNYNQSSWFVFSGTFLRLRNLVISYELPESLLTRLNLAKANVFLKGTNVLTLTKYPGYTPEIGGSVTSNGIDSGVYPVTSVYGVGLNITF